MVELAGHILDRKAGHFDPGEFKDEYELALRKLVKRKAAGHTIEAPPTPEPPSNVINIMDALRDSLEQKRTISANRKKSRPKSSKRLRKAS
jgi:DNA end-binding protein Ku